MLNLIYVLLFLAVVIALFGIANTLALSVVERRRELGLLRAVGMQRRQVRSSVRWEAVLIALLGTAVGTALGLGFGWALVKAMGSQGIDQLAIPGDAARGHRCGRGAGRGPGGGDPRPPGRSPRRTGGHHLVTTDPLRAHPAAPVPTRGPAQHRARAPLPRPVPHRSRTPPAPLPHPSRVSTLSPPPRWISVGTWGTRVG